MPKYVPKPDELYEIKACSICGGDTLGNDETCSDLCQHQMDIFKEDWEEHLMEREA